MNFRKCWVFRAMRKRRKGNRYSATLASWYTVPRAGGRHRSEEERIANRAASEFCTPQKSLASYRGKGPILSETDVIGFGNTLGIHPGVLAGPLGHKLGIYSRFPNLVKVRSTVEDVHRFASFDMLLEYVRDETFYLVET